MKADEITGTWSATDTPTLFTSHTTANKILICDRIGNRGKKEYYLLCIPPTGTRQYVSTLYTDYYDKLKAYNFDFEGKKYLWRKVRPGMVHIVPFGTRLSYVKLTM